METATERAETARSEEATARVDPRAPRFGQSITAGGLLAGVALDLPVLVFAVTAALVVPVATRWRVDPYGLVWRRLLSPHLAPVRPEPAVPHRFAKLVGATGTTLATVAILAGAPLVGYALAGGVAVAAGLAATTGICLGCRMYRSVSLVRRLDLV